jgi:hypothetical protein
MGKRIVLFLLAMFMALLAERFWVGHAGRAADDCMTKPGAAAPQGSHWYYHLDRTNHRQCWYLAAEGAKVRPHAGQAASPVRSQGAKPIARSQTTAGAALSAEEPAHAIPAPPTSVELTSGQGGADENNPAPGSSRNWSFLSASPVWNVRDAVSTTDGFEDNQSDTALLPPVVAPAEPQMDEPRHEPKPAQRSTLLVAVVGVPAVIVAVVVALALALFTKRSRSNAQRRSAFGPSPQRRGKRASSSVAAQAGQAEMPWEAMNVPLQPSSPMDDIELNVRRLLHELQQRQREPRAHDRRLGKLTV